MKLILILTIISIVISKRVRKSNEGFEDLILKEINNNCKYDESLNKKC